LGLKTGGDGFLRFGLKIGGDGFFGLASKLMATVSWWSIKTKVVKGFPDLVLKTGSYNLVIWASKSPRWFIGLGFKTKQALVC
jgi:hypothetical protein